MTTHDLDGPEEVEARIGAIKAERAGAGPTVAADASWWGRPHRRRLTNEVCGGGRRLIRKTIDERQE